MSVRYESDSVRVAAQRTTLLSSRATARCSLCARAQYDPLLRDEQRRIKEALRPLHELVRASAVGASAHHHLHGPYKRLGALLKEFGAADTDVESAEHADDAHNYECYQA